jgi:hypothetical protein
MGGMGAGWFTELPTSVLISEGKLAGQLSLAPSCVAFFVLSGLPSSDEVARVPGAGVPARGQNPGGVDQPAR